MFLIQVIRKKKNTSGLPFSLYVSPEGAKYYTKGEAEENGMKE